MCNCALFKHTHCIYLAFEDLKEATCMCHPSDVDMIWKSECILNSLLFVIKDTNLNPISDFLK